MTFPETAAAPAAPEQDPRISRKGPGILNQMAAMHEMTNSTQEYIARQTAQHEAVIAARKAEAARLAAIEREAEACAMAKDLLLNMVAGDKQTPIDFLSGQAFTLADRFYAERDRRAAAIK